MLKRKFKLLPARKRRRVEEIRKRRGASVSRFSYEAIGVSEQTYRRAISGKNVAPRTHLKFDLFLIFLGTSWGN